MKNLIFAVALVLAGIFPGGANAADRPLDAVGVLTASTGFLGLSSNECAATLIEPDKILTAAHCLMDGDEYVSPSDVTFHAQGGRVSVKVKRFLRAPAAETIAFAAEGSMALVRWAYDVATAELETPLSLDPLPLAPVSWSTVHGEQMEMHIIGMPDGVMEHQSGCFGSPLLERYTNSKAEQDTQTLRESGHTLGKFLPKGKQADFAFWLDIGAMPHTCDMRPGYSGGPTLIKHPKHGFMVAGVNVGGVDPDFEAKMAETYTKAMGRDLKPDEDVLFGVSSSMFSCVTGPAYSQLCEAGNLGAFMRHFYNVFMAVYDRHQISIGEFGAAAAQAVKCGYRDDAVGINAYLDSGRTC